jgi:hypothetical protein
LNDDSKQGSSQALQGSRRKGEKANYGEKIIAKEKLVCG